MKRDYILQRLFKRECFLAESKMWFFLGLISVLNIQARAEEGSNATYTVKFEDVVTSAHLNDISTVEKTAVDFAVEHERLGTELLNILKNPKSSNLNRCSAAYYLGEMRVPEAAEALAAEITLQLDLTRHMIKHYPVMAGDPAVKALIKIGNPSIPAVIRNLEESDDPKVKELSLRVIYHIEGDKEIVQLRLQRALQIQKDPEKKARLQALLDATMPK